MSKNDDRFAEHNKDMNTDNESELEPIVEQSNEVKNLTGERKLNQLNEQNDEIRNITTEIDINSNDQSDEVKNFAGESDVSQINEQNEVRGLFGQSRVNHDQSNGYREGGKMSEQMGSSKLNGREIIEKKPKRVNMVLYTVVLVLLTAGGVLFMASTYYGQQMTEAGRNDDKYINQEVVERVVTTQEEARIDAIDSVRDAIVGVINLGSSFSSDASQGSGIVYKVENGNTYIVTNEHVIAGGDFVEVVFNNDDNDRFEVEVIGSDVFTDLAVLRINGYEANIVAEFGNTEELRIGQTVLAIGNPLGLDFAGSVTSGIVSGHDRTVRTSEQWEMTVLQTDTAINPGNSGGALINLDGEVVGINSMKIRSSEVEGMSFSIPTYIALPIIADLETHGEVLRPTLGVMTYNMSGMPDRFKELLNIPLEQKDGVYVEEVEARSLAQQMGIQAGDVIVALNGVEVEDTVAFRKELFNYREGDAITVTLLRGGETLELTGTVVIQ